MEISDLRERQDLLPIAADRIWKAWWENKVPHAELEEKLRQIAFARGSVFSLVAHDQDGFAGTASVIPADMDERPQYSPWVAAVWIEPHRRGAGLGTSIVREAMRIAFERGATRLFLCARPALAPFYLRMGWTKLEEGVGLDTLTVFICEPAQE